MAPKPPQQQTLSVRITDAMRRRLERARQQEAARTGQSVSTSEIAKQFLESARDDRLELIDLLAEPTTTLVQLRRKAEAGLSLSRAEWLVIAHFVQVGVESAVTALPHLVSEASVAAVLDAFLSAYEIRRVDESPLDVYYLGNLPADFRAGISSRAGRRSAVDREAVARASREARRALGQSASGPKPVRVARSLYALLEGDDLPGAEDIDRALRPHWTPLWRLAARGHFASTKQPVRDPSVAQEGAYLPAWPAIEEADFTLQFMRGAGREFSILIAFPPDRGLHYPVIGVPRLAEFRAMMAALDAKRAETEWNGASFIGGVATGSGRSTAVWFRAHDNGITVTSPVGEWVALQRLVRRAFEETEVRRAWTELESEYGEW